MKVDVVPLPSEARRDHFTNHACAVFDVLRATTLDFPMPYNAKLEQYVIPQASRIIEKVKLVLYKD